jgi:hypothetical protein
MEMLEKLLDAIQSMQKGMTEFAQVASAGLKDHEARLRTLEAWVSANESKGAELVSHYQSEGKDDMPIV